MNSLPDAENANVQGRLLVNVIEEKAHWIPHHTYMRYPPKNWESEGYGTITWSQYADTIDKVAHWLDAQLGTTTENDTIAYFGPNDLRYAILVPATIKTGRKLLVPDGRVTDQGLNSLVASTDCKAWIYAEDDARGPLVGAIPQLQLCALPSVKWCLEVSERKRYPYNRTFEEAALDKIVIIHTSGTTGVPKPIYHTNGVWSAMGTGPTLSQKHWPRGIAHESWMKRTSLTSCAPQWLAGLHSMILSPVFMDSPCVMPPPDVVGLPPDIFKKVMRMNQVDGIKCPPHTIVQLYEDPEARTLLKSLQFIMYLGAALDRAIGDELCEHTRLTPLIGSTETGDQLSIRPADRKLWYTHDFVPENGSRMVRVPKSGMANDGSDDLYELILERPKHGGTNIFQPAFWNPAFEGLSRIETKEMYTPITDVDGQTRWIFSVRKDDLTKLNWLAKFHAQDIETRIQQHPEVQSVYVGGEGRPTPYVIVEAKEGVLDKKNREQLLEALYTSVISGTNKADIEEIRIPKEMVLLAKEEKPFRRNLKQVLLRKEIEEDYLAEIEEAYVQLEKGNTGATSKLTHPKIGSC